MFGIAVKGMEEVIKQRIKAANDLFSAAVSRVKQPIEAMFNWMIEKTDVQRARKVSSTKDLIDYRMPRNLNNLTLLNDEKKL